MGERTQAERIATMIARLRVLRSWCDEMISMLADWPDGERADLLQWGFNRVEDVYEAWRNGSAITEARFAFVASCEEASQLPDYSGAPDSAALMHEFSSKFDADEHYARPDHALTVAAILACRHDTGARGVSKWEALATAIEAAGLGAVTGIALKDAMNDHRAKGRRNLYQFKGYRRPAK